MSNEFNPDPVRVTTCSHMELLVALRLCDAIDQMHRVYGAQWPEVHAKIRAKLKRDAGGKTITKYAIEAARKAPRNCRAQILAAAFDDGD